MEDIGYGLIVSGKLTFEALFQLIEPKRKLLIAGEQLAQLHEGAHDINRYFDRAPAVENRRSHDGAVLGERIGQILAMLSSTAL
jgi:hypothetical protein